MNKGRLEALWKTLSISNEFCYFVGAVLFIIGSALANASMKYIFDTAVFFIIGSVLYLVGAAAKLVVDVWKVIVKKKERQSTTDIERMNVWASILFTIGGICFTIGASFFILNTRDWVISAEITWDIGSAFFLVGSIVKLQCDQTKLSRMYEDTPVEDKGDDAAKKRARLWMSVNGANWYFAGSLLFAVGSAVFIFNDDTLMQQLGNYLWIIGSICFMIGAYLKFRTEI